MKRLKKEKKAIVYLLTLIFFFPQITGCASAVLEEENVKKVTYKELALKYKGIRINSVKSIKALKKMIYKKGGVTEITQAMVDQYSSEFGYLPGEVDVNLIKQVVINQQEIQENGINQFINNGDFSNFTKQKLISISEGNVLTELDSNNDFLNLSPAEKELIVVNNVYLEESINEGFYSKELEPDEVMWWIVGGAAAGYLYGGVPGMLAGLLFGVIMVFTK